MRIARTILVVLAALAAAQATELEDKILQSIQGFQQIMTEGSPALDIPVLDPVTIPQKQLNINASPFKANIVVNGITGTGASGFKITQLQQIDGTSKVNMALELPEVDVTGTYDIKGKVKIGFISVKLTGDGPLTATLQGFKVKAVADVQEKPDGSIHINGIQMGDWSYDKLKVQLKNVMGGGAIGNTVNTLINTLAPTLINSNRKKINNLAETTGKDFINHYLDAVAGKTSLKKPDTSAIYAGDWILSEDAQQILNRFALEIVVASSDNSGSARAFGNDTPSLADLATKLLEDFKEVMKTGRPDFNIPVLDPAVVEKVPMDVKHGPFDAKIVAIDSEVKGCSDFAVKNVVQIDGTNKLEVSLEIPEIDIGGKFEMKGKVKIGVLTPKINDQGPLALTVKGLNLIATVDVQVNDDGSYDLKDVTMGAWSYESIHIQLDNLLGGGWQGKIANDLFNEIFPTLIELDRPKINARVKVLVQNVINQYLDGLAGKHSADFVAQVKEVSEQFRTAMKSGREDLNIPAMDPATIAQIAISAKRWPIDAQLIVSNISVSGASNFELTKVSQIVGTKMVSLEITVPAINIESNYDLESLFKVGFIRFNINKQGPMIAALQDLKLAATAELDIETDNALSLKSLRVDSWTYESLQVDVNNLSSGGFIKRTFNSLINKLVPALLVEPHVNDVSAWASLNGERIIARFLDAAAGRVVISHLDTKASQLLEQLRAVLKTGSEEYRMPVLDPATVDRVPISGIDGTLVKANIVAKEIQVQGTSEYVITSISQNENTNQLTVELEVDEIDAAGKFDATGQIRFIKWAKFTDSGNVTVAIKKLRAVANAVMQQELSGSILLRELKIVSWTFDSITTTFGNLQDGAIGTALNAIINQILPKIVKAEKDDITAWAEQTAKNVLDQFLSGVAAQSAVPASMKLVVSDEAHEIFTKLTHLASQTAEAA